MVRSASRVRMELAGETTAIESLREGQECELLPLPEDKWQFSTYAESQGEIDHLIDRIRRRNISLLKLDRTRPSLEEVFLSASKGRRILHHHSTHPRLVHHQDRYSKPLPLVQFHSVTHETLHRHIDRFVLGSGRKSRAVGSAFWAGPWYCSGWHRLGISRERSYRLSSTDIDNRGQLISRLAKGTRGEGKAAIVAVAKATG